jgi:hypothetical protein
LTRPLSPFLHRLTRRGSSPSGPYDPASYWESRANELIKTYDEPHEWSRRGWMRDGIEEALVPSLLTDCGVRSVFVVGAGSGRQYKYLLPHVDILTGIDISPTLVRECQLRYPDVATHTDTIVGAENRLSPAAAVLTSAVLQHVPPSDIRAAASSIQALAQSLVVIREMTFWKRHAPYQWAHPYRTLLQDWSLISEVVTDERPDMRIELLGFARPS